GADANDCRFVRIGRLQGMANRPDSASMAKSKSPTPENIADGHAARECLILSCAAKNIDHVAVGILATAIQNMEIRGRIERDQRTAQYALTDIGGAISHVLLKQVGFSTTELADYSVGTVWARNGDMYYLVDLIRARLDFPALKRKVIEV